MNNLELPLYANKPQRRIPGTTATAVTMYRSYDGTVVDYAILTPEAHLGSAHFQPKRSIFPRCYTMQSVPSINDERFSTLTEFAIEMGKRLEVDVVA